MTFDLIVFDWDGTLMDSQARIVDCVRQAFARLDLPRPSEQAASEIIGLSLEQGLGQLAPGVDATTLGQLVLAYRQEFLGANSTPSRLFPHARAVLDALAGQDRLLAVATGKSRRGLDSELSRSGLGAHFQMTRCADEAPSKPHPGMLHDIMDTLGMAADATLMIGDTEFDMQMAANAGVRALAVGHGVHAPERLLAAGALDCLDSLKRIPSWLAARAGAG